MQELGLPQNTTHRNVSHIQHYTVSTLIIVGDLPARVQSVRLCATPGPAQLKSQSNLTDATLTQQTCPKVGNIGFT